MFVNFKKIIILVLAIFLTAISCKHEPQLLTSVASDTTGYPKAVRNIIMNKCATAGCHNNVSKEGAGGLSLLTWDKMFEGSRGGAVIIPYRPDQSTLMFYINTDSSRGLALNPTMPLNSTPLSNAEYSILKDWIASGAPDHNGNIKFSDNINRKKFYTANQGCDLVTVFDANTMLAMRVIDIGDNPGLPESPHMIKVAPNNQFFCISYVSGSVFQKFSTIDHRFMGQATLGPGSWNTFSITPDSKTAYTFDLSSNKLAIIDLETMNANITGTGFIQPHGTALDETGSNLYVTGQTGNFLYKLATDFSDEKVITVDGQQQSSLSSYDLHEIHFTPDYSKYFVTCQKSNEVRALNGNNDSLLATIAVGRFPQEMGMSEKYPYLFISCMEDGTTFPGKRGSIYVVNYNTYQIVAKIYAGHQSHGIGVDDENERVYISNRNVDPSGPAPHHASQCEGRNGYITAIDIKTLKLIPGFKTEVSVDPYGVGITH